jgi:regulator of protease activity HflC (stomatin/prohibitin superfamily)
MISIIPQSHCRIIERFGKPLKVQQSGLAFKIPFLDKVRHVPADWGTETNKNGYFIELTEQITDTMPRECFTRDNAKITVDAVYSWRIVDPIKAVYEVDELHRSLLQAALNAIRSDVGSMSLDEILASRVKLNESLVSQLTDTVSKWGISLIRVEIQELKADAATSTSMLQQVDAERRSRALALEAEGDAIATIKRAQADKDAAILRAEGQAKALEIAAEAEKNYLAKLAETVGDESSLRCLLLNKTLESFNVMTSNPASKVFIPNSVNSFIDLGNEFGRVK